MTAQISDPVLYQGKCYDLAGENGTGLFDPGEHGMNPIGKCTACWRGFICAYRVGDQALRLDQLSICLNGPAPVLFGIQPKSFGAESSLFDFVYEELNYKVPYSGGLLLGLDFIDELYVHMGFHPAWKYREVHELIFDAGNLIQAADRSKEIAQFRQEVAHRPLEPGSETDSEEIMKWVRQCFSREYKW